MRPAPETATRGPPEPYIIDGQRFYNVHQAAQIIGTITEATVWRWAKHGQTPFGFELDIKPVPMIHDPRGFRQEAKMHREQRLLIPAAKVFALKEILRDDPIRPGPLSYGGMRTLEAAARRLRSPLPSQHL